MTHVCGISVSFYSQFWIYYLRHFATVSYSRIIGNLFIIPMSMGYKCVWRLECDGAVSTFHCSTLHAKLVNIRRPTHSKCTCYNISTACAFIHFQYVWFKMSCFMDYINLLLLCGLLFWKGFVLPGCERFSFLVLTLLTSYLLESSKEYCFF